VELQQLLVPVATAERSLDISGVEEDTVATAQHQANRRVIGRQSLDPKEPTGEAGAKELPVGIEDDVDLDSDQALQVAQRGGELER